MKKEKENIVVDDVIDKKVPKAVGAFFFALIAIIVVITLCRCFYTVNEQKNAVVTQFGSVVRVNTAGLYFKAPWQSVHKVDMTTHDTVIFIGKILPSL